MIPSGRSEMNMETLYQMTANYISLLQAKVSLLQSLSTFYGVWYSSTPKKKISQQTILQIIWDVKVCSRTKCMYDKFQFVKKF